MTAEDLSCPSPTSTLVGASDQRRNGVRRSDNYPLLEAISSANQPGLHGIKQRAQHVRYA